MRALTRCWLENTQGLGEVEEGEFGRSGAQEDAGILATLDGQASTVSPGNPGVMLEPHPRDG